jgi:hypothetical protein
MSGGWWKEKDGSWRQAGPSLQRFVSGNPKLLRLFNISSEEQAPVGEFKLSRSRVIFTDKDWTILGHTVLIPLPRKEPKGPKVTRTAYHLHETEARDAVVDNKLQPELVAVTWLKCKSIVTNSNDECRVGSWIFARGLGETRPTVRL